ncbi:hypothetical protein EDB19DRAFT_2040045 [Suillus lakei]|nr:hypothetical protein EDB19DRAFT_2040045 [Suillus lakei]
MTVAEEKITTAKAPFDNPDGDIILRSTTDHVDFHTFKVILSLMSPVFKDMFTLPQSSLQSGVSPVPVIPVVESSPTLEFLLLLCYPAATPTSAASLIRAADLAIVQFLPHDALELYALSCQFGWQHHAQTAATRALEIKDLGRPSHVFNGLRNITGFDYHRLLAYHQECSIAAQEAGKSLSYDAQEWKCFNCKRFKSPTSTQSWFSEYLNVSGKELSARPCESTLLESPSYMRTIVTTMDSTHCSECRNKIVESMDRVRALYIAQVKQAVASVRLADSE